MPKDKKTTKTSKKATLPKVTRAKPRKNMTAYGMKGKKK